MSGIRRIGFLIVLATAISFGAGTVHSATLYWDGGGADDNWSTVGNWDTDPGGIGGDPGAGPAGGDTVVFNAISTARQATGVVDAIGAGTGDGIIIQVAAACPADITITVDTTLELENGTSIDLTTADDNFTITGGTGSITLDGAATFDVAATSGLTITEDIDNSTFLLTVQGAGDTSVSGVISNTGGLTKAGAGQLTLSGANSYGGLTTISAGTLNIQNATALGATGTGTSLTAGATLEMEGGITVGTEALTLNGDVGANELISVSGSNSWGGTVALLTAAVDVVVSADDLTIGGVISGTVAFQKAGPGKLILTGNNAYTGATSVTAGTLNIQHANALGTTAGGTTVTAGATLELEGGIAVSIESLILNGGGGNSLVNVSGSNSWAGTCSLASAAVDIVITADDLTMSGAISGANNLNKGGAGTFTLSGPNTYSGALNVNAGTCELENINAFGTGAGGISLGAGSTLRLNVGINAANWDPAITLNGSASIEAPNIATYEIDEAITLGANTLTVTNTTELHIIGAIGGTGGITVDTADNLRLSGANTFSGPISVTNGELSLENVDAFGTGAGGIALNATSQLNIATAINAVNWDPAITLNAPATISGLAAGTEIDQGITIGNNTLTLTGNDNYTISGVIDGTGGVTINMTALSDVVTLSGANTFSGTTTVTQGTLNLQNNTAAGTTAGGVTVAATNAALQLEGGITVGAEALTLNGDGGAVVELESVIGSNRWQGPVTLATNAVDIKSTAGTLYFSNTISGQDITFDCNTGNINATGVIGPGAISVTNSGTGSLYLSGNNTYTGTLSVGAGGSVELAHPNAFGTGAGTLSIANGGTLILGDEIDSADWDQPINCAGAATIVANYSGCEIDENITTVGGTLTFEGTEHIIISGIIGPGAGAVTLNMFNVFDSVTLSGANTFTGAVNVTQGTLNLQNATATGTTAGGVTVASANGRLELEGGITVGNEDLWINGDAGAILELNNVSGDNTWNGAVTLATAEVEIQSTAGTLTFGSTMSGNDVVFDCNTGNIIVTGAIGAGGGQTLTKTGTGVLTLNGANNYTGVTTVSAGTINFNGISTGVSAVTASNAGTKIAGTGTIPGSVTMNDGTILAPGATNGDAVGTITISGTVTFNAESKYVFTLTGGNTDVILAGAALTATGNTPNIEVQAGYSTAGLVLPKTLMTITGAYTAFDETGLPGGWDIDNAKVGNDIRLTSIGAPPPPAAIPTLTEWGLILFSLLLAAFAIRGMRVRHIRAG